MVKRPRYPGRKPAKDRKSEADGAQEQKHSGSVMPAVTQQGHGAPEGNYAAQTVPAVKQQGGTPQEKNQPRAEVIMPTSAEAASEDPSLGIAVPSVGLELASPAPDEDAVETGKIKDIVTRGFSSKKNPEQSDAEKSGGEPGSSALGDFVLGSSVLGESGVVSDTAPPASDSVTAVVGNRFTASPRIRLSDPEAEKVKAQLDISRQKLEQLQETLKGFHGNDAPGNHNTPEVPFSEDELQTMRTMVAAGITLHETRVVSRPISDALDGIKEYLAKAREALDEAAKTSRSLRGLAVEVGATYLAIKELIDIFISLLGS